MNREIKRKYDCILEYTTKLSFPFMANEQKKKRILEETKQEIDDKLSDLFEDIKGFEMNKETLWMKAQEAASKEFDTLPEKLQLNSFYLQEVMHQYVELVEKLL